LIVFWFFFDLDFVIVCLWWKVQFGDGLIVFENGLVIGTCCFCGCVESAKTFLTDFDMDFDSVTPHIQYLYMTHTRIDTFVFFFCGGDEDEEDEEEEGVGGI